MAFSTGAGSTSATSTLVPVFFGAWFITSFWDSKIGTVEAEVALGRNVAAAAKAAGIEHLVYSTLESPAAFTGESFPTFDAKIGVEQEICYAGVPATFVQVAWYFSNLENNNPNPHAGFYGWPKNDDGSYELAIPIGEQGLHGIHSEDVGAACATIFAEGAAAWRGRKVALSAQLVTGEAMANAFRKVWPNTKFNYSNPDLETFRESLPPDFGDALYRMYKFYQARMPAGGDIEETRRLNPSVKSFEEYLEKCKERFKFD